MRFFSLILFFLSLFNSQAHCALDTGSSAVISIAKDTVQFAKLDPLSNQRILKRPIDSLGEHYALLNTKMLFDTSVFASKRPVLDLNMWNKSEMHVRLYQEKQLFIIDRWSFEFKKYVHGPKFAMFKVSISI